MSEQRKPGRPPSGRAKRRRLEIMLPPDLVSEIDTAVEQANALDVPTNRTELIEAAIRQAPVLTEIKAAGHNAAERLQELGLLGLEPKNELLEAVQASAGESSAVRALRMAAAALQAPDTQQARQKLTALEEAVGGNLESIKKRLLDAATGDQEGLERAKQMLEEAEAEHRSLFEQTRRRIQDAIRLDSSAMSAYESMLRSPMVTAAMSAYESMLRSPMHSVALSLSEQLEKTPLNAAVLSLSEQLEKTPLNSAMLSLSEQLGNAPLNSAMLSLSEQLEKTPLNSAMLSATELIKKSTLNTSMLEGVVGSTAAMDYARSILPDRMQEIREFSESAPHVATRRLAHAVRDPGADETAGRGDFEQLHSEVQYLETEIEGLRDDLQGVARLLATLIDRLPKVE